jgi:hypothetical protein
MSNKNKIPVLIVKRINHKGVYHLRMDKPFETYLSRLMIKIASETKQCGEVATVRIEE